jgi:hypothetical protein
MPSEEQLPAVTTPMIIDPAWPGWRLWCDLLGVSEADAHATWTGMRHQGHSTAWALRFHIGRLVTVPPAQRSEALRVLYTGVGQPETIVGLLENGVLGGYLERGVATRIQTALLQHVEAQGVRIR